ncbi:MAG TPA: hypothetical protein VN937_18455 [Blastocatellia bacterium]|nr:hypothetical protein [Blastocatellia bacterium]
MVSLEQRQALAVSSEADQQLKRFQLLLEGETLAAGGSDPSGVREELLVAISSKDPIRFKDVAAKIGERRISAESDWCQDDYLVFLLVLGNELFGHPLKFLTSVIEARRKNPNPIPRKINDVFAALERQEFGIEGEFCFLKIPFLRLAGKLRLSPSEAQRAICAMSEPELFDQMSPFMKLLMQKAYDLVLTERQPLATETASQLMEGIEQHAKDLSLHQWWRVLAALPGRLLWALIAIVISAGLIPVLFGVGKGIVQSYKSEELRVRPQVLGISEIREPGFDLPTEALLLAKTLSGPRDVPERRSLLITVESAPFATATPPFAVEVSHPERPISNAFAFTQSSTEGMRAFTVLPVQRDGGRFRAVLPEEPAGQRLYFVLDFEADPSEDVLSVGRSIILRPLQ